MTRCLSLLDILIWNYFLMFAEGITVTINKHVTATEGTNGTYLECYYSRENVNFFTQVFVQTLNGTVFENMISFVVNHNAYINAKWDFLKDRITFNNITNDANGIQIHFMKLLCVDNRSYRCHVKYVPQDTSSDPGYANSDISNISVKAVPSRPSSLAFFRHDQMNDPYIENTEDGCFIVVDGKYLTCHDIAVSCTGDVGDPPRNLTVTMTQTDGTNNILSLLSNPLNTKTDNCTYNQNISFETNLTQKHNKAVFRCSVDWFNGDQIYIEKQINILYQVRTPVITVFQNEDNVPVLMLSCSATGNPLPEYTWYRKTNSSQSDVWEFYANTQNISLTSVKYNGIYRCDVSNTIGKVVYKRHTTKIIYFKDKTLTITKVPDQSIYAEGTSKINLTCFSLEFQNRSYRWITPDGRISAGISLVITDTERSQSGVYTCILIVTSTVEPFVFSATEKIIIGDSESSSCKCASTKNNVSVIIGSVLSVLWLFLLTFGIFYILKLRKIKKMSESDQGLQMNSVANYDGSSNYEGVTRDRTAHHYDDLRVRKDNSYDNT